MGSSGKRVKSWIPEAFNDEGERLTVDEIHSRIKNAHPRFCPTAKQLSGLVIRHNSIRKAGDIVRCGKRYVVYGLK
jgi:hypothetical protein